MLQFNVQSLLDREGKTRYWLVKQMGTDYATVNKICDNASKSVRIDTLERLMKALDCEVQDLFTEAALCMPVKSVAHVGQQRNMARTLDGDGQLTLMESAGTGNAAGNDLRALGNVLAQAGDVFIVNVVDTVHAEAANLLAASTGAATTAILTVSVERHGVFLLVSK